MFLISNSTCSLLVHRKAFDFCILILHSATFYNGLLVLGIFISYVLFLSGLVYCLIYYVLLDYFSSFNLICRFCENAKYNGSCSTDFVGTINPAS